MTSTTISIWSRGCRVAVVGVFFVLSGCAARTVVLPSALATVPSIEADGTRYLFVFFDGTQNVDRSGTNVWRMLQLVTASGDPQTRSFYIEGVGTDRHPVTGSLLGVGMERRIRRAYAFLAQHHRPGDKIYIFGFSRGAHQARDLAGLLSYAGLPDMTGKPDARALDRFANRLINVVRREEDEPHQKTTWTTWKPEDGPILKATVDEKLGQNMKTAEVAFLGLWETVPGSFFKTFEVDACVEKADLKPGTRYKTGSYPSIRVIAQALATDEKRSRFRPLLTCEAIPNPDPATVYQTWFPGAHSDVGGGYRDVFDFDDGPPLATMSFNWMTNLLSQHYPFTIPPPRLPENDQARFHWSIGHWPGNAFSKCEHRTPLAGHDLHPSVAARASLDAKTLLVDGDRNRYPGPCKN